MDSERSEYFYGCQLTEAQAGRILSLKAELRAANGRAVVAELYVGAAETRK